MEKLVYSVVLYVRDDSYLDSLDITTKIIEKEVKENSYELILVSHNKVKPWKNRNVLYVKDAFDQIKGEYILFISADTLMASESLENMKSMMENNKLIGAVGPFMNISYFIDQNFHFNQQYRTIDEMEELVKKWQNNNQYKKYYTMHLDDKCLLVRLSAIREIGIPDYNLLGIWSADLSIRLMKAGYLLYICGNAYVHSNKQAYNGEERLEGDNRFFLKWGFRYIYSMDIRDNLLTMVDIKKDNITVLDCGCACGGNLMKIHDINPSADLYGVELNSMAAQVARIWGTILESDLELCDSLPWLKKFDIIIMGDILEHLRDTDGVLKKINTWLKPNGTLLLSVPNIMHISILKDLIENGRWSYREEGILDKTHVKFFTRKEIIMKLEEAGFKVSKISCTKAYVDERMKKLIEALKPVRNADLVDEDYTAYQWLLVATNVNFTSQKIDV